MNRLKVVIPQKLYKECVKNLIKKKSFGGVLKLILLKMKTNLN